ncbi:globin domain-containing protein [Streptomyces sp. NBRC 110611]|uniref:globin domain-containing protein n=1 Tax=Streptomyces sp. NBRC 110611 TaxID=1621259 RepID=UPI002852A258|nr:globin domain-containing protein [Streptomyces sp. NBRC 110611]
MNAPGDDYHALLARHEAMRLRRRLLAPGHVPRPRPAEGRDPYDGASDQRVITRFLDLVAPFDELIDELYEVMFSRHPYLRSLFPDSMEFQQDHLAQILRYLVERLDRPDEIATTFAQLGRDHRKLGVRPAHYQAFEEALCEALWRRGGARWDHGLEQAWLRMLRFAVAAMVDGAESALTEPPCWQATVVEHHLRSPDLAVLRLRPHEPYPYRAGQYASVASPLLEHTWRPYYLAGAPRPDGELEIHVRAVGSGGVSEALVRRTRPGDTVWLGPARGALTLDDGPVGELLFLAYDTGWAAVKALLEEVDARRPRGGRAHLLLGPGPEPYDSECLAGSARRRPWLTVVPLAGPGPGPGAGAGGYGPEAEDTLRRRDWSRHRAFVSGPPEAVAAAVSRLTDAGVPAGHIRHDRLDGVRLPGAAV